MTHNNQKKKKKILIIEDDLYTRELYEEVLTEAGFIVDSAANGEEGLVKAQRGGYNLILLDVMMPKIDGLGVLSSLKENPPKVENGPIILLTNLAHDPVITQALKLGAKTYLIKSDLNPDELVKRVREHI